VGKEPVKKGCPDIPHVGKTGGAGSIADAD
jgi:hypothetical protein